ncbi:uncharacterized protein LOC112203960 [Rosa chinensis]|uniref:uncharacterized protein LOC112203960 n=1 Tax=Rosa chinensis TaxID=74649 RepID=UPI000D08B1BB|nr:uncharacterized protein LOC112203960 [Rosa chinensis]
MSNTLFHMIDAKTSYNLLLGRPWVHKNGVVPSTLHQCFKFYNGGVKTVAGDTKPFTEAGSYFVDSKFYRDDEIIEEVLPIRVPSTGKTVEVRNKEVESSVARNRNEEPHKVSLETNVAALKNKINSSSPVLRFIREVQYPKWIANIVPVKKKNGQLCVCVDFRDLNDACSKDDFPLPIIELMVDAKTGMKLYPSWMGHLDTIK